MELATLTEALKSKKSYDEMRNFIHHAPDNHFSNHGLNILQHGLGHGDATQDDYARHSILFDRRLSDDDLDKMSQHIASQPTTTHELEKNFNKNVNSVGILRAALRTKSPDTIADLKKNITADHKHAIFSHGSEHEKAFLLQHGLVNKTQLSNALDSDNDTIKAHAIDHLHTLKDSGNTTHQDLFDKHISDTSNEPEEKESFFDRIRSKFKENLAKRKAGNSQPTKRIAPTFDDEHMKNLKLEAVMENTEELFYGIEAGNLNAARETLESILATKIADKIDSMKKDIGASITTAK